MESSIYSIEETYKVEDTLLTTTEDERDPLDYEKKMDGNESIQQGIKGDEIHTTVAQPEVSLSKEDDPLNTDDVEGSSMFTSEVKLIKTELLNEYVSFDDDSPDTSKSERRSRKQKTPIKTRMSESESGNAKLVNYAAPVVGTIIYHKDNIVLPTQEVDVESFINQFVTRQDAASLPQYELYQNKTIKKRGPKKTEQLFQCTQCDKTFSYKCNLQMHAAVHSSEKTHKCSICNKSFKLKGHLDTHRKVHEERYEYKCDICGKEFKLKGNIKTHIRTKHLDERSHQCTHCDMAFKLKQHLSNHLRIKHGISLQGISLVKLKDHL